MREIDFLPQWYVHLQARRSALRTLVFSGVVLVLGLSAAMALARQNELNSQAALDSLKSQVQQANNELAQMQRLETLQKQWRQQAALLNRLGNHIEASRLLAELVKKMPDGLALSELSVDTEEAPAQLSSVARAALKDPNVVPTERRVRVKLQGYAPTDVELATFLTDLNSIPFFDNVAPTYVRDRRDSGHILREFELTFTILVSSAGGV